MSEGEKAEKDEKPAYDPLKQYKDYKCENEEQYKNGPIGDESRGCTDCICCIIFLAFLCGMGVVAYLGFTTGDPLKLIYPYDEEFHQCGRDEGYEDYKYLYFYNVVSNLQDFELKKAVNAICVKECPKLEEDKIETWPYEHECKTKPKTVCQIEKKNYYRSTGLIERFCVPDFTEAEKEFDPNTQEKIRIYDEDNNEIVEKIVDKNDDNFYTDSNTGKKYIALDAITADENAKDASNRLINLSFFSGDKLVTWMSDLYITWPAILGSVAWSFVLAMIFLFFIRCCAGFIIYTLIICILAGLIALSYLCHLKADTYKTVGDNTYEKVMLAFMWVCGILAAVWFIFILVMCNRIRLAVGLIEATGKYINNNCCIVLVPFLFFIFNVAFIAYWVLLSAYLYSSGEFDEKNSAVIANFKWDSKIRYSWWFHLFSLLYICEILSAISQFVYASSACIWYFTNEKGTEDHPICKSFKRVFRYHLGSLAFGSLIIAIIRFLMLLLESFKKKIEKTFGKKSETGCCYKCIICCLQCFLKCIQKTMEFINKHAYIEIALRGKNFCTAAFEGFALIVKNLGRFSSLILLGSLFSLLGTIFISIASGIIGYFVITKVDIFADKVQSLVLPIICFVIVGAIMGMVSMSVFGMSSDALMHAFLLDEELNKGQSSAMPELQKFMSAER